MKNLLDVPFAEWSAALELGPRDAYRARQILTAVFQRRVKSFSEMTDLPQALRERLAGSFRLRSLQMPRREVSAEDGTSRLFFEASDGGRFSAVLLPSRTGDEADDGDPAPGDARSVRTGLCLSTQVGCAWGCVFCASGRVPFERNLTPSEILEQVFSAEEVLGGRLSSLVFMGMGEPLANFDCLVTALQALRSPLGFHFGARHVTVSTTGLAPQIAALAEVAPKVNLAISLHAADDETRRRLMPKSARWTIKELLRAAWEYQRITGGVRVTFEYIVIKGVNDSVREAQRLANMLRGKKAWVNLIAYNPVPGLPYARPSDETLLGFAKILKDRGLFVHLRKPQGVDITAGCGQLGAPTPIPVK